MDVDVDIFSSQLYLVHKRSLSFLEVCAAQPLSTLHATNVSVDVVGSVGLGSGESGSWLIHLRGEGSLQRHKEQARILLRGQIGFGVSVTLTSPLRVLNITLLTLTKLLDEL